jgi:hypothetical protein
MSFWPNAVKAKAKSRNALWLVLGVLAVAGGGIAVAVIMFSNKSNATSADPAPKDDTVAGSALKDAAVIATNIDAAGTGAPAVPSGPPPTLGTPVRLDIGDLWQYPRSDGSYYIASPLFDVVFPDKPTVKIESAKVSDANHKPIDVYTIISKTDARMIELQLIPYGRHLEDKGMAAGVERELAKQGKVTAANRMDGTQRVDTWTTKTTTGSTVQLEMRVDSERGFVLAASTESTDKGRADAVAMLASVHIRAPADTVTDPETLVGVRIRKAGKKLVVHDRSDSFTLELPWPAKVQRTVDGKLAFVKVEVTAEKKKSQLVLGIIETAPWDAIVWASPSRRAELDAKDAKVVGELAGGQTKTLPAEVGGLQGTAIDSTGRTKQKVQSRTVYNAFQHRRYTLTCVEAPCDAVAKSLHFADPQPVK